MTYRSLFVEEHTNRASAIMPYDIMLRGDAHRLCSLNAQDRPSALAFAREHDLHVDYVDNCWLLVALDAGMLKRFLRAGRTSDGDVADILVRVKEDHWYVINEEDF